MSPLVIGKTLAQLPLYLAAEARGSAKIMVVADAAVSSRYGKALKARLRASGFDAHLITLPPGERSKTLAQAETLYQALARARFERTSQLIALGGGVTGDLTGFVAATYLRGIPYIQAPTTLLAQVDAAIGGKTGVDIPEGKNLVGAFYHPRLIWIDPELLKSLPKVHWSNGLAEVIKYGAIFDAKLFEQLEKSLDRLLNGYSREWLPIIARCAAIKSEVVRKDPTEMTGLRANLNFGHSVGHAIEAAGRYRAYLHGQAISIGMFVAAMISEQVMGLKAVDRIRLGKLLTKAGLPVRVRKTIPRARLLEFLSRDKKVNDGSVRFVLLKKLGQGVSGQTVRMEVLDKALRVSGL